MIINGFRLLTLPRWAVLGDLSGISQRTLRSKAFTTEDAKKCRWERRERQQIGSRPMPFRLSQTPYPHL